MEFSWMHIAILLHRSLPGPKYIGISHEVQGPAQDSQFVTNLFVFLFLVHNFLMYSSGGKSVAQFVAEVSPCVIR